MADPNGNEEGPIGAPHRGLVSLMRRHSHHLNPEQHARLSGYLTEHAALKPI